MRNPEIIIQMVKDWRMYGSAIDEITDDRAAAHAFALALALLTWLHGSQDDEWLYCQPPLTDGEW